jgi:hypothetical protein
MTYFILLTSIRSFDVTTGAEAVYSPNKISKIFFSQTELDVSKLFHLDNQEIFVFFFVRRLQKKRFYLNGTTNPGGCAARQLGTTGLNGAPAGEQLPLPTY